MFSYYRLRVWVAACAIMLGWASQSAQAHPFHTMTAEMEFNSLTGRYEVSIKVLAADLEEALARLPVAARQPGGGDLASKTIGKSTQIDLERTPHIETLIATYLNRHFTLARNSSRAADTIPSQTPSEPERKSAFHWVGLEVKKAWAWLYFELEPVGEGDQLVLTNSMFFELNAGQINTCVLSQKAGKTSLKTSAKQPAAVVPQATSQR